MTDTSAEGVERLAQALQNYGLHTASGSWIANGSETAATLRALSAEVARLREALEWYGQRAAECRLIHSGGDQGRADLSADGGKRARAALASKGDGA